jgi:hypothetical protein
MNYFNDQTCELFYNNFIINYSKKYKNKISVFNREEEFCGDYNLIIEVKNLINKNLIKIIK